MTDIEIGNPEDAAFAEACPSLAIDTKLLLAVRHLLEPSNMDSTPVRALRDIQSSVDRVLSNARRASKI